LIAVRVNRVVLAIEIVVGCSISGLTSSDAGSQWYNIGEELPLMFPFNTTTAPIVTVVSLPALISGSAFKEISSGGENGPVPQSFTAATFS
jgi:hypothetical protein